MRPFSGSYMSLTFEQDMVFSIMNILYYFLMTDLLVSGNKYPTIV